MIFDIEFESGIELDIYDFRISVSSDAKRQFHLQNIQFSNTNILGSKTSQMVWNGAGKKLRSRAR